MTMFITALPIACFFALITNIVKTRISAYKLFTYYQRPIPKGAQDIGSWQGIYSFISTIAVITNGALICFTMDVIKHFSLFGRSWIFIGFQWTLIFAQFLIAYIIPDVPADVEIQAERKQFITAKLIEKLADEDFDPNVKVDLDAVVKEESEEATLIKKLRKGKGSADDQNDVPVAEYPLTLPASGKWPALMKSTSTSGIRLK
jgi:hypothetical protein